MLRPRVSNGFLVWDLFFSIISSLSSDALGPARTLPRDLPVTPVSSGSLLSYVFPWLPESGHLRDRCPGIPGDTLNSCANRTSSRTLVYTAGQARPRAAPQGACPPSSHLLRCDSLSSQLPRVTPWKSLKDRTVSCLVPGPKSTRALQDLQLSWRDLLRPAAPSAPAQTSRGAQCLLKTPLYGFLGFPP